MCQAKSHNCTTAELHLQLTEAKTFGRGSKRCFCTGNGKSQKLLLSPRPKLRENGEVVEAGIPAWLCVFPELPQELDGPE